MMRLISDSRRRLSPSTGVMLIPALVSRFRAAVSMPMKTSPTISTPRMAEDSGSPPPSSGMPKVMRGPLPDRVEPINASSMPSTPITSPFIGALPATAAIKERERMISAAFSGRSSTLSIRIASTGAVRNNAMSLKLSPQTELKCATFSAFGPSPFIAIGCPSRVVR